MRGSIRLTIADDDRLRERRIGEKPRSARADAVLSMRPTAIIADDREVPSGIPDLLSGFDDVDLEIKRLELGDYFVDGRVLVERKSLADFAASVVDTRLFRQASRLTRSAYRCAVMIEGRESDLEGVNVSREALQGAVISLGVIFNLPVLRSRDCGESARLIAYTARQLRDAGAKAWFARNRKPKSTSARRLRLLQCLPGIGRDRAERLLAHFGTVENCFTADAEALLEVEGIGEKTALAIRRIVAER